jgi:drug/metabolite transporter (DMT)-like permease
MKGTRGRAELSLALIALIWGATFVSVKSALDDVSPVLFVAIRFAIASAALALIFRNRFFRPIDWVLTAQAGAAAGVLLCAGYVFQTVGLRYTTPAKSAFVTSGYIVLVPLLGALVYKKAPRQVEVLGFSLAFAGLLLMTIDLESLRLGFGDLLTLVCAAAFAGHILVLGHYAGRVAYEGLSLIQVGVVAMLSGASVFGFETPGLVWSGKVVLALFITALLATALAFAVQTWAQQLTTPNRAAIIFSLEPVFAAITSYALRAEEPSGRALAGAGLILSGILAVEWKPSPNASHHK